MSDSITSRPNGVGRQGHAAAFFETLAQASAPAMRVALRRADGHAGRLRDLFERVAERVLQEHDLRLLRRDARRAQSQSSRRSSEMPASRAGRRRTGDGRSSGSWTRARRRSTASRHVLTTSRCSHVENCEPPRNCFRRTQTFASASCAASLRVLGVAQEVPREPLDPRLRAARAAPRAPARRRPSRA